MSALARKVAACATVLTFGLGLLGACSLALMDEELQDGECPPDTKACDEECHPTNRANLGCARRGCAPCNLPHAVAICSPEGQCAIGTCQQGYRDCDPAAAGCETDTNHDPDHCGGCNRPCDVLNGVPGCAAGNCVVGACDDGFEDCDGVVSNGCEAHVRTSNEHCGDCDQPCGGRCVNGRCL